jgi:hypothetical protein
MIHLLGLVQSHPGFSKSLLDKFYTFLRFYRFTNSIESTNSTKTINESKKKQGVILGRRIN